MTRDLLASAIGGPNALSKWSAIALLPLGILAGTLWGLRNGLALGAWLPVVIGIHLLLLAPFLLCRSIMVRAGVQRPKPWLGLGIFAFLGGLRALTLAYAGALMGVELPRGAIIDFLPNGIGTGIAILGVVAVVVDGSRRHRAVVEQLSAAEAEVERTRAFDEAALADAEARSVAQITGMLEQELRNLQPSAARTPEQVAAQLRTLASDIVRPLSHELAHGEEWIPVAEDVTTKPPRWERAREVIADMRPANPLAPFLLIELIALPSAISERVGGVAFSAFIMLLIGSIMYAMSWAVTRLWPNEPMTLPRLVVLIALYAVIGTFAAWVGMVMTQWYAGVHDPRWIAPFFLIITSIGVSFTTAVQAHQRADEDRMAMALARNAQLSAQVRESSRRAQRRVAKLLHSNIQAELIASAMLISSRASDSSTTASHTDISQQLDALSSSIHQQLSPPAERAESARERILDLTSLWSSVLEVELESDAETWEAMERDADALDAVIDVVAEGLTNAVRHGHGQHAVIAMSVDDHDIHVRVTSLGALAQGAQPGLGSEVLAAATSRWSLAAEADRVHLTAQIPRSLSPR